MANVTFTISWPAVSDIVRYDVLEYHLSTKLTNLLGTAASSVTSTGITVDETAQTAYQVRGHDGTAYVSAETFVRNRPAILATLRKEVRLELKDTEPDAYKWSNDELNQYVRAAIKDYSKHFPLDQTTTIPATADVREYPLASALQIHQVVYVSGGSRVYLKPKPFRGGELEVTGGSVGNLTEKLGVIVHGGSRYYAGHYDYFDDTLRLDFDPRAGTTLEVRSTGLHDRPSLDTDAITVPEIDWELLSLYAQAKAFMRDAGRDASLQRWDTGTGRRDDNPLLPRETRLFQAYQKKIEEKKQSRPRHLRRVRV